MVEYAISQVRDSSSIIEIELVNQECDAEIIMSVRISPDKECRKKVVRGDCGCKT